MLSRGCLLTYAIRKGIEFLISARSVMASPANRKSASTVAYRGAFHGDAMVATSHAFSHRYVPLPPRDPYFWVRYSAV